MHLEDRCVHFTNKCTFLERVAPGNYFQVPLSYFTLGAAPGVALCLAAAFRCQFCTFFAAAPAPTSPKKDEGLPLLRSCCLSFFSFRCNPFARLPRVSVPACTTIGNCSQKKPLISDDTHDGTRRDARKTRGVSTRMLLF